LFSTRTFPIFVGGGDGDSVGASVDGAWVGASVVGDCVGADVGAPVVGEFVGGHVSWPDQSFPTNLAGV